MLGMVKINVFGNLVIRRSENLRTLEFGNLRIQDIGNCQFEVLKISETGNFWILRIGEHENLSIQEI